MMAKDELLTALAKFSSPKFPKNVYKERFFSDFSVRWLIEKYRSGEIESSGVFARLGEKAGLFTIALAEGYSVPDIARAARVSSRIVRRTVRDAFWKARIFNLVPQEYEEDEE